MSRNLRLQISRNLRLATRARAQVAAILYNVFASAKKDDPPPPDDWLQTIRKHVFEGFAAPSLTMLTFRCMMDDPADDDGAFVSIFPQAVEPTPEQTDDRILCADLFRAATLYILERVRPGAYAELYGSTRKNSLIRPKLYKKLFLDYVLDVFDFDIRKWRHVLVPVLDEV